MKDRVKKFSKSIYFFLSFIIFFLYLFPGNILGFIFYNDPEYKFGGEINEIGGFADMILNTGGYAINHFFVFLVLSFYGIKLFFNKSSLKGFCFFVLVGIILELLHIFIPNRSFQTSDLISNLLGILISFLFFKKKYEV